MSVAEYLRQQAAACQRLARNTFDLTTAERLRYLAADFEAKAEAVEDEEDFKFQMVPGNGFSRSTGQNDRD
jgi:hypothetical protein